VPLWLPGDPAAQFHPTPARTRRPDLRHRTEGTIGRKRSTPD
jgi:hypothetical protein